MTADKIIKALECCIRDDGCEQCSILEECFLFYDKPYAETPKILILSLDLINRQRAEIERWRYSLECVLKERADHSDAIEEFAERLKEKASCCVATRNGQELYGTKTYSISAIKLDNLVKEMVGESK